MAMKRKPTHPGDILRKEFLEPNFLTAKELSELVGVHRNTINNILNHKATISTVMAYKLAKVFDTTPMFWLNLQQALEVWYVENDPIIQMEINYVKPFKKASV